MEKSISNLLPPEVKALRAIAWPNPQFHTAAIAALSPRNRWGACAWTQLGFIRLASNPSAEAAAKRPRFK